MAAFNMPALSHITNRVANPQPRLGIERAIENLARGFDVAPYAGMCHQIEGLA